MKRLSEFEASIDQWKIDGIKVRCIMMHCPLPGCDHDIRIPFSKSAVALPDGRPVWKHEAGATVEDITLSPSYHLMKSDGYCGLHGFVRNGNWIGV